MLNSIHIKNFKSILDDKISLGRVNVFIGENGSGKSNILEALMFAKIGETYKTIDADILYTNGIRVSKPSLLLSSFKGKKQSDKIMIDLDFDNFNIHCQLVPENKDNILSKWKKRSVNQNIELFSELGGEDFFNEILETLKNINPELIKKDKPGFDEKLKELIKASGNKELLLKLYQFSENLSEKGKAEIRKSFDTLDRKSTRLNSSHYS